jgi:hypothetical protein
MESALVELEALPQLAQLEVMSRLPDDDLLRYCKVSSTIRQLCPILWKQRLNDLIGDLVDEDQSQQSYFQLKKLVAPRRIMNVSEVFEDEDGFVTFHLDFDFGPKSFVSLDFSWAKEDIVSSFKDFTSQDYNTGNTFDLYVEIDGSTHNISQDVGFYFGSKVSEALVQVLNLFLEENFDGTMVIYKNGGFRPV